MTARSRPPRRGVTRSAAPLLVSALLAGTLLAACGPEGGSAAAGSTAAGTRGAAGAPGTDGADGADGADGTSADGSSGTINRYSRSWSNSWSDSAGTSGPVQSDVQQVEYHQPIATLDLRTDAGSIDVVGDAPADTVRITRRRSWTGAEPVVTDQWAGTTLTTRVACDSCGVSFEVHVPPSVATRLAAGAGNVTVTGLTGDADLSSSSGTVTARDLTAATVSAQSRSGGVALDLAGVPQQVRASTAAGSVTVAVPAGSYRVDATTSAGRTAVSVPQDPSSPRTIDARSSAGSVTVRTR